MIAPKPRSPASSASFAKKTSATFTRAGTDEHDVPDDEHGEKRAGRDDEPQAVGDVAPVAAGQRLLRLQRREGCER